MYKKMHLYNTQQSPLKLREYGRSVQRLIEQLPYVDGRSMRNQQTQNILKIMGILHAAHHKGLAEPAQKRWDDLCMIADYNIEVDSPYPIPAKALHKENPGRLAYAKSDIRYRHYGRHMVLFVQKILALAEPSQKAQAVLGLTRIIKSFGAAWNKDNLDNGTIIDIIQGLSGSHLDLDVEKLKADNSFRLSASVDAGKKNANKIKRSKRKKIRVLSQAQ
jgi:hypothetical protein